jgi:hypothetical protein
MATVAKILVFTVLGVALLAANAWYFGAVYHSVKGGSVGSLVIAPFRIIGGPGGMGGLDEALARMLVVRLRIILSELEEAQSSLREAGKAPDRGAMQAGAVPIFPAASRTVRLDAQLFEPATIDVKVAGVEVSGLLSWLQRWFVEDRTLNFTVSLEKDAAFVAGNVDALGNTRAPSIWRRVADQSPQAIVDEMAFALIQRAWAKDGLEVGELKPEEFRTLVLSMGTVAEINRRVRTSKYAGRVEYASVLNDLTPLADRITSWNEFTYFVATIAESAEDNQRALVLYRRLKEGGRSPLSPELLEAKLQQLDAVHLNAGAVSLAEYRRQAALAGEDLGRLFGFTLPAPPIELAAADYLNVYWDGTTIHAPPGIGDIPDLIAHEVAWSYMAKLWDYKYSGQSGALASSYTDVLASIVKQSKLHQSADQADWTIAPGGIAWVTGKSRGDGQDQRPLRSLKAPGTAYNDPLLGKDPQVAHYRDLVTTTEDQGGVHTNSGIPNKAFYEAAMKIGTDKAGRVWVEGLKLFEGDMDLPKASRTIQAAAAQVYGNNSAEYHAVQGAWAAVGL